MRPFRLLGDRSGLYRFQRRCPLPGMAPFSFYVLFGLASPHLGAGITPAPRQIIPPDEGASVKPGQGIEVSLPARGGPATVSFRPETYGKLSREMETHMEAKLLPDERVEVTTPDGRRFTFPIHELQATRRPPRLDNSAADLPVSTPLQVLEAARSAAQEFAILNDLI